LILPARAKILAPRWQRGKIARAVAAKAAIASRVDFFGTGINQTLLDKLNVRVNEISEKYKEKPIQAEPQKFQNVVELRNRRKKDFKPRNQQKRKSKKFRGKKRKKFGRR